MAAAVTQETAREALAAVDNVRRRASTSRTAWEWVVPTSLAFGVSLFLSLQGSFWGLVLVLASLGLVVAIEVGVRGSATRVAMKQPVRDNERFDWRTIVPFIVIYTAWIFLPEGNAVVSALAGAAAAALMLFAYWKWWDA